MAMLRRLPKILSFIPGTAQDVRAYFLTLQYWLSGSEANVVSMVRFLVDRYADGERRHLRGAFKAALPIEYPEVGVYHPGMDGQISERIDALPATSAENGTVGLVILRSYVLAGDGAHYDGVIRAFEDKGLRVIPAFANGLVGVGLLAWAIPRLPQPPHPVAILLYPLLVVCGVAILYSLVIMLAAATIHLGRNQSLYDFWFYLTNFSRYPAEIYSGPWGGPLRALCTFVIPILLVVNVPARVIAQPLTGQGGMMVAGTVFAAAAALVISRWVFQTALSKYRSASS
jgi:hypothetical protein